MRCPRPLRRAGASCRPCSTIRYRQRRPSSDSRFPPLTSQISTISGCALCGKMPARPASNRLHASAAIGARPITGAPPRIRAGGEAALPSFLRAVRRRFCSRGSSALFCATCLEYRDKRISNDPFAHQRRPRDHAGQALHQRHAHHSRADPAQAWERAARLRTSSKPIPSSPRRICAPHWSFISLNADRLQGNLVVMEPGRIRMRPLPR